MENRIDTRMRQLAATGKKSLSIVIMIGDPDLATTVELMEIALEVGVDVFEFGIPMSDPVLDSSVMRDSMRRALAFSSNYDFYLETLSGFRERFPEAIFEIMIYHETVEKIGLEKFSTALAKSDMDCVLVADGVFKGADYLNKLDDTFLPKNIYPIRFVPHPYKLQQFDELKTNARGFIIVQTKTDAKGQRDGVLDENKQSIKEIRSAGINLPLVFAYGIKTPADAQKCISLGANGVLIGTVLLDAAHRLSRMEYKQLLRSLRQAV